MIAISRRRLADSSGVAITEMLVAMSLSLVVLGATLATFEIFDRVQHRNQATLESQDRTRAATDQLARQLRNLASPTPQQPQAVEVAAPYDLVFQTVDDSALPSGANTANVRRVRYCLGPAPAGGKTALWSQSQTWTTATPPAVPSTTTCPSGAWPGQRELVEGITNQAGGQDRPLFQFNSTSRPQISAIITQLWTQARTDAEPTEGLLRTQLFLRNQNQVPTADFDARATGLLHLLLNASASADPEGEELTYKWYDGSTYVGSGILFDLKVASPGVHTITLHALDPAGLESTVSRTATVI